MPAPLISPGMLRQMRRTLAARRTETAIVLRQDVLSGEQLWPEVAEYPCRRAKDFIPPRVQQIGAETTQVTTVLFGFAVDVDLQPGDRLQIGEATYRVQGVDEPNTVADLERIVHALKFTS